MAETPGGPFGPLPGCEDSALPTSSSDLCMLNSQGRVPVGPQVHLFVESGLASEMARTTPTGGEVARLEMLAVWGVARQTRIPESTDAQRAWELGFPPSTQASISR